MARARNYRAPHMIVRQRFVNDGGTAAVTAAVHISGPHANFIARGTDSFEKGFLGNYSEETGLSALFPRVLSGNFIDTSSDEVVLTNAALRYFQATTESFAIPANSRNTVSASGTTLAFGFSFRDYGNSKRYAGFFDRDVRVGDIVKLTAAIGGETKTFWSSVARLLPRYLPGEVVPAVVGGASNATTSIAASVSPVSDDMGFVATPVVTPGLSAALLAKGSAVATYTIQTIIGGSGTTARFAVFASNGDGISSVAATEEDTAQYSVPLGTSGAKVTFSCADNSEPSFVAGTSAVFTATAVYTPIAITAGGTYTAAASEKVPKETVYTLTVTKGGYVPPTAPADNIERYNRPTFSVTTNTGLDSVPLVRAEQSTVPLSIGRYGVQIVIPTGHLIEGDRFFVTAKSSYSDIVPFIGLRENIPADWVKATDTPVTLELFIPKAEVVVPQIVMSMGGAMDNWAIADGMIQLRQNLMITNPSWTVNGELSAIPVVSWQGRTKAYYTCRYFVQDLVGTITPVTTAAELDEVISGPVDPSNPLKYAAYHALADGDGSQVLLTAVSNPNDLSAWERVTDLISARDDVFHVLPLCYGDQRVIDLFYQHIKSMNQDEVAKERLLYLIDHTSDFIPLAQGEEDSQYEGRLSIEVDTTNANYVAFTSETSKIDFLAIGVRAGDVIRTNPVFDLSGNLQWTNYTITDVVNTSTVRLENKPGTINVDGDVMIFEVWRNQTTRELSDRIASTAGIQDMLVRYLLVDNADKSVDPIGPAASFVGLIGSVVPHQGVSWYPLAGWSEDGWQGRFSNFEMNHMAGNGVTIITRHADGFIAARHSVTTAKAPLAGQPETALSLKLSEEMYIRNALLIKKEFRNALRGYVGVTNLVQGTMDAIKADLTATANYLKADDDYPRLGGRISSDLRNLVIRPHAFLRDQLVVSFTVDLPFALNALDCTIFV